VSGRLEALKKARERMIEDRDTHAKVLAAPFDRDKAERARNKFIEIQMLIDALDRAISGEELISPKSAARRKATRNISPREPRNFSPSDTTFAHRNSHHAIVRQCKKSEGFLRKSQQNQTLLALICSHHFYREDADLLHCLEFFPAQQIRYEFHHGYWSGASRRIPASVSPSTPNRLGA
jgi:hypothetical protein